ncbi:MAG: hypothetical protein K1X44_08555 [Alphaproteobacteria bacterium]|nr:hypothetical protein [Alphaproteobacteria bacterium]
MGIAIVFLPLLGALIAGLGGKIIGDRISQLITTLFMLICAGLSWFIFFDIAHHHQNYTQNLLTWIQSGSYEIM